MQELASLSIAAETMIFEVAADLGFIMMIDKVLVSEFLISVSKSTLT